MSGAPGCSSFPRILTSYQLSLCISRSKCDSLTTFSASCEAVPFPFAEKVRSFRSAEVLHPITPKPGVPGTPALRHPESSVACPAACALADQTIKKGYFAV